MKTAFLNLSKDDLLKGIVLVIFTSIGMTILPTLESGALPTLANLQAAGISGVAAGLAYIVKNLLTNSNNKLFASEKNETSTVISVPKVALPAVNDVLEKVDSATNEAKSEAVAEGKSPEVKP